MNTKEFELEKEKLFKTIEIIKDILVDKEEELKNLFNNFIGDREELWKIADMKKIHIRNIKPSLNKPYFPRIHFTYDKDESSY